MTGAAQWCGGEGGESKLEGESKDRLMGVPKVHCSQSQGNPEPHSINLVALSLSWPGSKKRKTWIRTASGRGSFRPNHLCNGPFWFQEQKVKTEKVELRRRPRIGVNWSQGLTLANFLKDTSAQERSPNQTLIYNLTVQEFPASFEPCLFYAKFSPPHLCQETAEKASHSGEERQQKRKFKEVCTVTALRFSAIPPSPLQKDSNKQLHDPQQLGWKVPKGEKTSHHLVSSYHRWGSPGGASGKESTGQGRRHKRRGGSLGQEYPLEEGTATHSSTLVWRILWTKEPGELQPIGLQRDRHDWSNLASTHLSPEPRMISPPKPCYS